MNEEEFAEKLLEALKAEALREPNLLNCKSTEEIGEELMQRFGVDLETGQKAFNFLAINGLLKGNRMPDGSGHFQPSPKGFAALEERQREK
jgi:hypothetical protein